MANYMNAASVRKRYGGISDMTLWRWLHDHELGFPQPLRINGRRLWTEPALEAFDRKLTEDPDHQPAPERERAA